MIRVQYGSIIVMCRRAVLVSEDNGEIPHY